MVGWNSTTNFVLERKDFQFPGDKRTLRNCTWRRHWTFLVQQTHWYFKGIGFVSIVSDSMSLNPRSNFLSNSMTSVLLLSEARRRSVDLRPMSARPETIPIVLNQPKRVPETWPLFCAQKDKNRIKTSFYAYLILNTFFFTEHRFLHFFSHCLVG